jgi:hypothetical protein
MNKIIGLCWFVAGGFVHAQPAVYDMDKGTLQIPYITFTLEEGARTLGPFKAQLQQVSDKPTYDFTLTQLLEIPVMVENSVKVDPSENNRSQRLNGHDRNNSLNGFIQPQDAALSGKNRSQTLNAGDVLVGGAGDDILIGGLGVDVLLGNGGRDILIGGTEDFFSDNQDRLLGGDDNDVMLWSFGDGNDYFDGGHGDADVAIVGMVAEQAQGRDEAVFAVETDQNADEIYIDKTSGLPLIDVSASPVYCEIIDSSQAQGELAQLNLDHLIRIKARDIGQSFDQKKQNKDNGLRSTLHFKAVEFLICNAATGDAIQVFDLTKQPPKLTPLEHTPRDIKPMVR